MLRGRVTWVVNGADAEPGPHPVPPRQSGSIFPVWRQSPVGALCRQPACTEGSEQHSPPSAYTTVRSSGSPIPVTCLALWELSLNNTLMEKIMKNQIIAAGRELKPFFIPRVPGPRLRAPPWERCTHPIPLYGPPSQAQITAAILH